MERDGFTADKIKLKSQQKRKKSWEQSNWTRHAVRTYQPSLHPFQAFLAEPKVGVSIAAGSSHRDHSLVPVRLYPDHGGGAETFGEWYQQVLSKRGTSSCPVIVSHVDASNKRLLVWLW